MRGAGHAAPLTPVAPDRKAVFFGASYHADYATVLARPADMPAVARAVADALAADAAPGDPHPEPWTSSTCGGSAAVTPAADELAAAFGTHSAADGWTVVREREEVCPILDLAPGLDFEGYLGTLGKKDRHEVRRKVRRAEARARFDSIARPTLSATWTRSLTSTRSAGARTACSRRPPAAIRAGPSSAASSSTAASRAFIALHFLTVGGRRVAAGIWFDDGETLFFYNAGVDPEARELSPGVVLVARSIQMALEAGRSRFDFLRGDESYKYGWGARDVPIQRLLVRSNRRLR